MKSSSPRSKLFRNLLFLATTLGILGVLVYFFWWARATLLPIKVGILHSRTGSMAISETSMIDAEVLALEEINAKGGLLGRNVEWVIADGASDWPRFAQEARRLITEEKVSVIFGCWTSASRKNVKPVVEELNHLLVYPMAYEGLEESPNIVYTVLPPTNRSSRRSSGASTLLRLENTFWWARTTSGRTASMQLCATKSRLWAPKWWAKTTYRSAVRTSSIRSPRFWRPSPT